MGSLISLTESVEETGFCAPPLLDRDWRNICVVMTELLVNGLGQELGNLVIKSSL